MDISKVNLLNLGVSEQEASDIVNTLLMARSQARQNNMPVEPMSRLTPSNLVEYAGLPQDRADQIYNQFLLNQEFDAEGQAEGGEQETGRIVSAEVLPVEAEVPVAAAPAQPDSREAAFAAELAKIQNEQTNDPFMASYADRMRSQFLTERDDIRDRRARETRQQEQEQERENRLKQMQAMREQELEKAAARERQAGRYQQAALMLMQSAQQPIGPSTIGEAISGKYGTRQSQVTTDINAARQFFEQSGRIRRDQLTEAQAKQKAGQIKAREDRLRQSGQSMLAFRERKADADRKSREAIAAARRRSSEDIADGNWKSLEKRANQRSADANARIALGWSNYTLNKLAANDRQRGRMKNEVGEWRRLAGEGRQQARNQERQIDSLEDKINDARMQEQLLGADMSAQIAEYEQRKLFAETQYEKLNQQSEDYLKAAARQAEALEKVKQPNISAQRTGKKKRTNKRGRGRSRLGK